jgi:hypothetical protein
MMSWDAVKAPVLGVNFSLVDATVIGKLPVVVLTNVGYQVAIELVSSVIAVFVAFVAVVAVEADPAEPSMLVPVKLIDPVPRLSNTAVVPM